MSLSQFSIYKLKNLSDNEHAFLQQKLESFSDKKEDNFKYYINFLEYYLLMKIDNTQEKAEEIIKAKKELVLMGRVIGHADDMYLLHILFIVGGFLSAVYFPIVFMQGAFIPSSMMVPAIIAISVF